MSRVPLTLGSPKGVESMAMELPGLGKPRMTPEGTMVWGSPPAPPPPAPVQAPVQAQRFPWALVVSVVALTLSAASFALALAALLRR